MLKKLIRNLLIILLLLFIGITIYGAVKYFKEQFENKKNASSNYTIYEKNEKSNIDKINDGLNNLFKKNKNNNSDDSSNYSDTDISYENIDEQYNTYNFDDSLLLYEGINDGDRIISLLNRLIRNADDKLYTNTSVTIKNFGSLDKKIDYSYKENNIDEYKNSLIEIRNNIVENEKYVVSFGYNKYKTHVNEIIIEK